MLAYYGYTISPNQIETGEGFLICKNVPIARTGTQDYLGSELGLSGGDSDRIIEVIRSPDEVFSVQSGRSLFRSRGIWYQCGMDQSQIRLSDLWRDEFHRIVSRCVI